MERMLLFRVAAGLIAVAAGLYIFAVSLRVVDFFFDLLILVFLSWIVGSVARRLTLRVQRLTHAPFGASVALAYLIMLLPLFLILALVVPVGVGQVAQLSKSLPEVGEQAPEFLAQVQRVANAIGLEVDLAAVYPKDLLTNAATNVSAWLSTHALEIASATVMTLFQVFILLILSLYMVLEGDRLASVLFRLLPRNWHDEATYIYRSMDDIFQAWLRGVVIVGTIFGVTIFVTMLLMGLPYSIPVGVAGAFLVMIPFGGDFIAIGIPVIIAITEGSLAEAAIVGGVLLFVDIVVLNLFVSPRVIGGAVRLPTVLVVLSILFGARIAGPLGALLGIPTAALIYSTTLAYADRARQGNQLLQRPEEQ